MEKFNETEMSILKGLKDALSFAKNESNDTKIHKVEVKNIDIKELCEKSDLTQEDPLYIDCLNLDNPT